MKFVIYLGIKKPHVKNTHLFKAKNMIALNQGNLKLQDDTTLIDEAGLYSLILRSKLPAAEDFQEWVTSEVLPAIRKGGGYKLYIKHTVVVLIFIFKFT
jgi:prophage antirepressor-like protein